MLQKFWDLWSKNLASIRLDFGTKDHQRELTLTFNFLSGIVWILVLLTGLWAIAAGVLQSGRLVPYIQQLYHGKGFWVRQANWVGPIVGIPVYALKAFTVAMLVCFAAASMGAIIGFLFGVPRPISETGATEPARTLPPTSTPTAMSATGTQGTTTTTRPSGASQSATISTPPVSLSAASSGVIPSGPGWQASTNLTQVSDWLTKIIIGVGLVEATKIYDNVSVISGTIGNGLFDGLVGTRIILPSLMIAGFIIGFMYSYLFTQLFLAALMAYSAQLVAIVSPVEGKDRDIATMASVSTASPILAPSINQPASPEPVPRVDGATETQKKAAESMAAVPLDQLDDPAIIQAWARSHAVLDDYSRAAQGYHKLLQFWSTPDIMAEAARVLAANKEMDAAKNLLIQAVAGRESVAPDVRSRITFDAANLSLYDPPPGGYTRALDLLDEDTLKYDPKGGLHILRACANGQRYKHREEDLNEVGKARIRQQVLDDLKHGLSVNEDNRAWVRFLWDPNAQGKSPPNASDRDDDLEPFFNVEAFRELIDPQPS